MHTRTVRPFFLSVLLHGAAVGLVLWFAWRMVVPAAPVHIFDATPGELVSSTASSSGLPVSSAQSSSPGAVAFTPLPVPVSAPRVAPVEPDPVEVVPPVAPASAPTAPPVVVPRSPVAAAPAMPTIPVAPSTVRPRENPRPTPVKAMTLAEFRKAHPLPAASSARPAPAATGSHATTAPANPPKRIEVAGILGNGETSAPGAGQAGSSRQGAPSSASPGEGGERDSFLAKLSQKLREAHRKPEGMDDGLRAGVAFVLHESGTISDVRIAKSSGDEAFDASAVAAFKSVTALGRPPVSLLGANVIVFRTTAD